MPVTRRRRFNDLPDNDKLIEMAPQLMLNFVAVEKRSRSRGCVPES